MKKLTSFYRFLSAPRARAFVTTGLIAATFVLGGVHSFNNAKVAELLNENIINDYLSSPDNEFYDEFTVLDNKAKTDGLTINEQIEFLTLKENAKDAFFNSNSPRVETYLKNANNQVNNLIWGTVSGIASCVSGAVSVSMLPISLPKVKENNESTHDDDELEMQKLVVIKIQ